MPLYEALGNELTTGRRYDWQAESAARNAPLLVAAALGVVAFYSLLIARGMGPRWTGWFSIGLVVCVACDARVRRLIFAAWSEIGARAADRATLPWRAALLLVAFPNLLLLLCHPPGIQTGDSRAVVVTAASLLSDGDFELSEVVESYRPHHYRELGEDLPYFLVRRPGGVFSHYPSGMLPFALPVLATAKLAGAALQHPVAQQSLEQLTAALVAAACATLFFLLAWQLAPPRTALVCTVLLATGSVMFSTVGQALWQQGGVIFWAELLLLIELRAWRHASYTTTLGQGAALAMMLACRLSAVIIAVTFGLWVLFRSPYRAVQLASAALFASLPWMLFNWWVYGNVAGPMAVQAQGFFWSLDNAASWAGVLASPTHGLLIYQPWLLLAMATLWLRDDRVSSSRGRRVSSQVHAPLPGLRLWALATVALHVALVSSWWCWWGGLCWGSRLLSEAVPLAALLCLGPLTALLESRIGRPIVFAMVAVSSLLHVPSIWLHQDLWYQGMGAAAQEANAWRWRSPPFLYPLATVSDHAQGGSESVLAATTY